jgi:hypothetical protein
MSLLTYKDARPWAKAIQAAVLTGMMPPWHADPAHGQFANDRRLSEVDKNTIAAWVTAGAPEGNPADVPSPPKYVDGWQIGEPDVVFEMTEDYEVPARGVVESNGCTSPPILPRRRTSRHSRSGRAIANSYTTCSRTTGRSPMRSGCRSRNM